METVLPKNRSSASAPRSFYIQAAEVQPLQRKLAVLADAAKYDASCASSGAPERDSQSGKGIGSTQSMGICHSFTPDGRCVALLKILLTNFCIYDCLYCINRSSSNVERARFKAEEVVLLTLDFYRRNTIEGLFLSSGIIQSPDYTMAQLVEVARQLREVHDFRGYIHLKTIPDADPGLLALAGRYADRLSVNIELPTQHSLAQLAPEKNAGRIVQMMRLTHEHINQAKGERLEFQRAKKLLLTQGKSAGRLSAPPRFAPGGQSTQMIVGADATPDASILRTTAHLYSQLGLRRVYYSAFSPIPDASRHLPLKPPPLMREHRLYQADWLLRFYGYGVDEIIAPAQGGMLDLDIDPKLAWALGNRPFFPIDLQSAPREALLRIPGLGTRGVAKIIAARRIRTLCLADLQRLRNVQKMLPFIMCSDYHPGRLLDDPLLKWHLLPLSDFATKQAYEKDTHSRPLRSTHEASAISAHPLPADSAGTRAAIPLAKRGKAVETSAALSVQGDLFAAQK